jgi:hypothetical protein
MEAAKIVEVVAVDLEMAVQRETKMVRAGWCP